jgi:hypothetical protein
VLIGRALRPPRFRRATRGRRGLPRSSALGHRCGELVPRDPYIREKFIKEVSAGRQHARQYFERYPKDRCQIRNRKLARDSVQEHQLRMKRRRAPRLGPCQQQGTYFDAPSFNTRAAHSGTRLGIGLTEMPALRPLPGATFPDDGSPTK